MGESGCMSTIVSCKEHDHSKHDIYDICETNEGSETALQMYCQAYKQAPVGQAHALLRKDRRPDSILNILTDYIPQITPEQNSKDPACVFCLAEFSRLLSRLRGVR
ncbi:uncharacterized protein LACBIDRAFT_309644 [Laccaria bicolor S238N-H82]|uniref:Predicted protein n=1 Tax=Laccaria bicolor (strain S238N-H82 / ATCC MYA-4686) TaxID=486041 RepID=B0DSR2_LACBS|nr:uncharacterized protein LACBIDRAFT_309644 [Laccaria bicolor S238N-H82]EDR02282.1 predicted protein [Laccaria bicolor S238N-H82]|eukprot:XP_001886959.1 predicted protein [Laccaria bicolor S238N-H82]